MNDPGGVAKVDPLQDLLHILLDLLCIQRSSNFFHLAQEVVQVHIACLLDEVNVLILHHDVQQCDNVGMLQVSQYGCLSDGR